MALSAETPKTRPFTRNARVEERYLSNQAQGVRQGRRDLSQKQRIRNARATGRRASGYTSRQYTDYETPANDNFGHKPANDNFYKARPANDNSLGQKTVDQNFRGSSAERPIGPAGIVKKKQSPRQANEKNDSTRSVRATGYRYSTKSTKVKTKARVKRKFQNERERVGKIATKAVANFMNAFIQPPLAIYYTFIQLPLALMSLVLLAVALLVAVVTNEETWLGWTISVGADYARSALEYFGAGFIASVIDPTNWMIFFLLVVGGLNMLVLSIIYISFIIVGSLIPDGKQGSAIQPIFGEQAVLLKFSAFVAVLVCSFMPLVNLIPPLNIWTFVVSRFPR